MLGFINFFLGGFVGANEGNHRERESERERESSQRIAGISPTTWERGFPERME